MRWPLALLVPALFVATPVFGNGRFPNAGQIAIHPTNPAVLAASTNYGILSSHDAGKSWQWLCEPALGIYGDQDPFIAFAGQDRLVVATKDGIQTGVGDLCGWAPVAFPLYAGSLPAIDLARDPTNVDRVLAIVTQALSVHRLLQTLDGGATWQPLGPAFAPEMRLRTVEIAPSNGRIYVSSSDPSKPGSELLWRSDDGGLQWQSLPLAATYTMGPGTRAPEADVNLFGTYISAVDPTNADRLYVRGYGDYYNYLWQSDDAGAHWTARHVSQGLLLGFALAPNGEEFVVGGPGLEGGELWVGSPAGGALQKRSGIVVRCLTWTTNGLYACGEDATDGFTLGVSTDGGNTFAKLHRRVELTETACDSSTTIGKTCPLAWPAQAKKLGIGVADSRGAGDVASVVEPPAPKEGCRASRSGIAGPPALPMLAGLLAVWLCRERLKRLSTLASTAQRK